ncbi:aldo/keto reductase [Spirosoma utsteinense]|uniref:Aryl-alcohol dehydrogenase-like putative oxidoreductase n=1 Tax=Spirosoma utsteinense TaxID=2585773 RepID=A0ABR6WDY7_9BACT|nr:aldo/keto reductase [Spirosoma utsteinense]MBC3788629.1 aryl-alcohol dehydrogenase-like putative oxidoreductase [Spirosoma utsteinense]MBC3794760.1 aryl-alcohol dehydrogenase-like putative oxidoreductase [Spirosoma utsteinense]
MQSQSAQPVLEAGTITLGGDLTVNRLAYGAMRITGDGIWGPPKDHDEAIRVLKRSLELGINFIDTADSYGPYVSEELIAEALYPYADGLVIGTKGGLLRTGPNQWPVDGSRKHLQEALDGSLKRLRLDRIDLYQLHRFDDKVPAEEFLGFLKEMQQAGKIRHIGLSEVSVEQIKQAQEYFEVVSVQNMYNFGEQKWNSTLKFCEENNIAFIPWYPLSAGNLEADKAIHRVAERQNATEYQVALAWLLAASPMMLPIAGTSSVKHLEENMQAATIKLTDEDFKDMPLP